MLEQLALGRGLRPGIAMADGEVLFLLGCLYGCKNSARAFFIELRNFMLSIEFHQCTADGCVYVSKDGLRGSTICCDD